MKDRMLSHCDCQRMGQVAGGDGSGGRQLCGFGKSVKGDR